MISRDSELKDPITGSHPSIRFEQVPVVEGRLSEFEQARSNVLNHVVQNTFDSLDRSSFDLYLGEALFQEKLRLRKAKKRSFSFYRRYQRDSKLWGKVKKGLLQKPSESDRNPLVENVLSHYAEEIGGHFDPRVYWFATRAVPWIFSWLLNAASVNRFLPWGMTESLQSRLTVLGEIPLLQKVSKKGTILLVPTHQSNIDSILIGYVIYLMSLPPFAYGAGLNLFTNPVLSFFMGNLGAYTVDRMKGNFLYKNVLKNYSTQILHEGIHSIFFPGGGRSRTGAIESSLKLGLLGTALEAQYANLKTNKENPNVYIVPMVMSYNFVLEASSLIAGSLARDGKHRFIIEGGDNPLPFVKFIKFFWKLFSNRNGITVRIGRPLDVFGNLVDDDGVAIGPNGSSIDARKWLTTEGMLCLRAQRDREYVRRLGTVLVDRYYRENTVLSSHLVAFAYFMALRKKYPELDLYQFLRLSYAQRSLTIADFKREVEVLHRSLREASDRGELYLSRELQTTDCEKWIDSGIKSLGAFHRSKVVLIRKGIVATEDMNLLYYYRNRLSGYGFSLFGRQGRVKILRGETDEQGFLA